MTKVNVLDHGSLDIIETWGSDERIIESARMSTDKGFLGWGVEEECEGCNGTGTGTKLLGHGPNSLCPKCQGRKRNINKPGDEKLLRYLWENKHSTPFEMAGATFEVQAPIFVFREWHRHRVPFGYSEMSARYVPLPNTAYVPTVERLMINSKTNKQAGTVKGADELTLEKAETFRGSLTAIYETAEGLYQEALLAGVPKELARIHLPVGRYSKMRATSNLRGWLAFLTLRNAPTAQYEIRVYAEAVQTILAEKFPRTLALFAEGMRK
jgi:thymidylate synthase (FAD)